LIERSHQYSAMRDVAAVRAFGRGDGCSNAHIDQVFKGWIRGEIPAWANALFVDTPVDIPHFTPDTKLK